MEPITGFAIVFLAAFIDWGMPLPAEAIYEHEQVCYDRQLEPNYHYVDDYFLWKLVFEDGIEATDVRKITCIRPE